MPVRVSFVCQQGRLESQAVLLAASLRLNFPSDTALIAAHPHRHGPLAAATLAALSAMNVAIAPIENPLAADYPIGNKLAALALLQGENLGLFLDSDILAIRAPDAFPAALAAVPASVQHCNLRVWTYLYDAFGLTLPADPPAMLLSEEKTAPYYNTGFIAMPGPLAAHFSKVWIDCARRIDADPNVPLDARRPYLDQLAFPIAAALCGQPVAALDEKWNYRGWGWDLPEDADAILFHYQEAVRIGRQLRSAAAARAARHWSADVEEVLKGLPEF